MKPPLFSPGATIWWYAPAIRAIRGATVASIITNTGGTAYHTIDGVSVDQSQAYGTFEECDRANPSDGGTGRVVNPS